MWAENTIVIFENCVPMVPVHEFIGYTSTHTMVPGSGSPPVEPQPRLGFFYPC